jgi:two-component system, NtrC family, sensor kinase
VKRATLTPGVTALIAAPALAGVALLLTGHPGWSAAAWLWAVCAYLVISRYGRQQTAAVQQRFVMGEKMLQSQKLASLGELAAGVAHEINNPLAIIRQEAEYTQFLLKKSASSAGPELAELQDSLREIITQVDRSREITRNLLDFARKREPVLQKVQLNRLIEDMARLVEKEAKNKNIALIRHYDPELPVIISDPPLLRQVILNLLNNASQAIGQDGQITIATAPLPPREISITVADSGPGIPPAILPKIFDPFFTTKPQGQGTGLGLAICHGIIQKLAGRISAASPPGQGAAFTIILPLEANPASESPADA